VSWSGSCHREEGVLLYLNDLGGRKDDTAIAPGNSSTFNDDIILPHHHGKLEAGHLATSLLVLATGILTHCSLQLRF
jgi:hypothetical protein